MSENNGFALDWSLSEEANSFLSGILAKAACAKGSYASILAEAELSQSRFQNRKLESLKNVDVNNIKDDNCSYSPFKEILEANIELANLIVTRLGVYLTQNIDRSTNNRDKKGSIIEKRKVLPTGNVEDILANITSKSLKPIIDNSEIFNVCSAVEQELYSNIDLKGFLYNYNDLVDVIHNMLAKIYDRYMNKDKILRYSAVNAPTSYSMTIFSPDKYGNIDFLQKKFPFLNPKYNQFGLDDREDPQANEALIKMLAKTYDNVLAQEYKSSTGKNARAESFLKLQKIACLGCCESLRPVIWKLLLLKKFDSNDFAQYQFYTGSAFEKIGGSISSAAKDSESGVDINSTTNNTGTDTIAGITNNNESTAAVHAFTKETANSASNSKKAQYTIKEIRKGLAIISKAVSPYTEYRQKCPSILRSVHVDSLAKELHEMRMLNIGMLYNKKVMLKQQDITPLEVSIINDEIKAIESNINKTDLFQVMEYLTPSDTVTTANAMETLTEDEITYIKNINYISDPVNVSVIDPFIMAEAKRSVNEYNFVFENDIQLLMMAFIRGNKLLSVTDTEENTFLHCIVEFIRSRDNIEPSIFLPQFSSNFPSSGNDNSDNENANKLLLHAITSKNTQPQPQQKQSTKDNDSDLFSVIDFRTKNPDLDLIVSSIYIENDIAKGKTGDNGDNVVYSVFPESGIVPFSGMINYISPMFFLYFDNYEVLKMSRVMYSKYFKRLHHITTSFDESLLVFYGMVERLLMKTTPTLMEHFARYNLDIVTLCTEWFVLGYSNKLMPLEYFALWDRIIAYDSLLLLPLLAAAILYLKRDTLLAFETQNDIKMALYDLSAIEVVPLLQSFLFI